MSKITFEGSNFIIQDISDSIPKHPNYPYGAKHIINPITNNPAVNGCYKNIEDRDISKLYLHQTGGSITSAGFNAVLETNRFIINDPDWVYENKTHRWVWTGRGRGWPKIPYTFYIPFTPAMINNKFVIYQCNPLNVVSWHSSDNYDSISCVCQGYFKSRHMKHFASLKGQNGYPSAGQSIIVPHFIKEYAIDTLKISPLQIKGHCDSPHPKLTCPGDYIESVYKKMHNLNLPNSQTTNKNADMLSLDTWEIRQAALVWLGNNIGNTGPHKNGIDGDFGELTRLAIENEEKIFNLPINGYWNDMFDFSIKMLLMSFNVTEEDLKNLYK